MPQLLEDYEFRVRCAPDIAQAIGENLVRTGRTLDEFGEDAVGLMMTIDAILTDPNYKRILAMTRFGSFYELVFD